MKDFTTFIPNPDYRSVGAAVVRVF